jgi:hypothetical protein
MSTHPALTPVAGPYAPVQGMSAHPALISVAGRYAPRTWAARVIARLPEFPS